MLDADCRRECNLVDIKQPLSGTALPPLVLQTDLDIDLLSIDCQIEIKFLTFVQSGHHIAIHYILKPVCI